MKCRIAVITFILVLTWIAITWAGWVIQETANGENSTLWCHDNQIKVESDGRVQIFNIKTNKLFMLNPAEKIYWRGDAADIKQGVQSMIEEALEGLPEEQRQAVSEMMQTKKPGTGAALNIEIHATGETKNIAGYKTYKYELLVDGDMKEAMWLAPKIDIAREIDLVKLGEMMKALTMDKATYEFDPKVIRLYKKGYPLRRVVHQAGETLIEEAVQVEKKVLSDSQFKPPAGYREASFQETMQSMQ